MRRYLLSITTALYNGLGVKSKEERESETEEGREGEGRYLEGILMGGSIND